MKPELYLHIGPHKTGTTYIQKQLVRNQKMLESCGCFYPDFARSHLWGHHDIVSWLANNELDRLVALKDSLSGLIASESKVILSSEDLSKLSKRNIGRLKSYLNEFDVKVVFYVRSWGGRIYSSWQERVKFCSSETLPEFVANEVLNLHKSNTLNYVNVLTRYSSVFGEQNMRVVIYDDLMNREEDIFLHLITKVLGVDTQSVALKVAGSRVNSSMSHEEVEIMRAMNVLSSGNDIAFRKTIVKSLRRRIEKGKGKLTNKLSEAIKAYTRSMEIIPQSPCNKLMLSTLVSKFGNSLVNTMSLDELLETSQKRLINYCSTDYLLNKEITTLLFELYDELKGDK